MKVQGVAVRSMDGLCGCVAGHALLSDEFRKAGGEPIWLEPPFNMVLQAKYRGSYMGWKEAMMEYVGADGLYVECLCLPFSHFHPDLLYGKNITPEKQRQDSVHHIEIWIDQTPENDEPAAIIGSWEPDSLANPPSAGGG